MAYICSTPVNIMISSLCSLSINAKEAMVNS